MPRPKSIPSRISNWLNDPRKKSGRVHKLISFLLPYLPTGQVSLESLPLFLSTSSYLPHLSLWLLLIKSTFESESFNPAVRLPWPL